MTLERRKGKGGRGRRRKRRLVRRHIKVTAVVEYRKQIVLAIQIRRGPDSDNKDFIPSYTKVNAYVDKELRMVVADKGYDAEASHEFIREELKALSIIPPRRKRSPDFKTRGKYRREMRGGYPKRIYNMRNLNETVNSVVKRAMGGYIRALKCKYQNREVYFKFFAYNVNRTETIILFWGGFLAGRR
jgi:hypothetical protein